MSIKKGIDNFSRYNYNDNNKKIITKNKNQMCKTQSKISNSRSNSGMIPDNQRRERVPEQARPAERRRAYDDGTGNIEMHRAGRDIP